MSSRHPCASALGSPLLPSLSIASDDPLFGEMLRVVGGVDGGGSPECSWQPLGDGGAAMAPPEEPQRRRRARPLEAAPESIEAKRARALVSRCLDGSHSVPCALCTAAPGAGEAETWMLVGDPGRKNGEKKLRALLNKVPEWNSGEARESLAAQLGSDAMSRDLAIALRAKSCASLRKVHLLRLCAAWNYACDLWRLKEGRRGDVPRTQARPPQPLLAAPAPAAPQGGGLGRGGLGGVGGGGEPLATSSALVPQGQWDYSAFAGASLASDAAADHILSQLRDKALECAWKFEGASAREAAQRLGAEHITPVVVDALSKVTRWLRNLLVEWGQQHSAVLAWSRRLASPTTTADERRELAWVALAKPGAEWSLDSALALIASLSQTSVAACSEKGRLPGVSPAEAAWLREFGDGSLQGLEVIARLQALLNQFKFAPLETFLSVAARVLELGMLATSAVAANFNARDAWMRDMLAANQRAAAVEGADTAASGRQLELFEFKGFPERMSGGVMLLEGAQDPGGA